MKNSEGSKKTTSLVPRRTFLGMTAGAAGALTIGPRQLFGSTGPLSANDKLNIAAVGVGGMGKGNLEKCETENIVALCDVDMEFAAKTFAKYPKAKTYQDFRVMFDQQKDIDAVIVATPDHTHAVIAMAAMERGKHVYVQKPLTHSVYEARLLTEAARQYKVATQMGNQGHSGDGARLICEWIWAGAIGPVREVHTWTNRPVWPQGVEVERPTETPAVPSTFDWDLWIGPAPFRPYHPTYHPSRWRAWWDFGTGSLGDMGCHIIDPVFWALKLKYPVSVEGCISAYWQEFFKKTEPRNETYPRSTIVRFKFPAREGMPEVRMTWWDGGLLPPRPDALAEGQAMGDDDGGVLFIGDEGIVMCGCYGRDPVLLPEARMRDFKQPPETLERIPNGSKGHEQNWIQACKGGKPACSNFDYSGPLTETVLMGNLAVRFPDRRLLWDGMKMEVTNDKDATTYVRRKYRQGWSLS
ncbi:MAG: Gfo/Idh/MocA family oxidoreductase [Terriglobia bacterium]